MPDYRQKLYEAYVRTHMKTVGDPTKKGLDQSSLSYDVLFRDLLPMDRSASIAEVGCGYGPFLYWLQKLGYQELKGVDSSPEMAAYARKLGVSGVEQGEAVAFLNAHFGIFERVFSIDMIEHLRKDEVLPFLEACFAALRPGGMLIIQTVNAEAFGWGRIRYGDFTHECAYTPTSMSQCLLACGFEPPRFLPARPFGNGFRSVLRRLVWRGIEQIERLYLHAATGSGLIDSTHILTDNFITCARKPKPVS